MKYILLLLGFLSLNVATFSQEDEEEYQIPYEFEVGQTVYLLGDSVNIRKSADLNAEVVTKLPIGSKLKIISKSDKVTRLNNFDMPWYYVEINKKQKGYVWGGKIAMASCRSTENPDIVFHFGIEKATADGEGILQIRVEKGNKQLQALSFEGFGRVTKRHTFTNHGNRGLKSVNDVLYVDGFGEFCGDGGGAVALFWADNKLIFVKQLWDMFDAPVFGSQRFLFPADMEGEKDRIILREEAGEYVDDENDPTESKIVYSQDETTRYKWNGKELVKI